MISSENFAREFVVSSINKAYEACSEQFYIVKQNFSEESVHDYRVAVRRSLSLILLLEQVCRLSYAKQIKKLLKAQIKLLNPLRDTQVQLLELRKSIYTYPALFNFYVKKLGDEQIHINNFKNYIDNFDIEEIRALIFFQNLQIKNKTDDALPAFSSFFNISQNTFLEMKELSGLLSTEEFDTYHKLRLAVKKYRYIVEFLFEYINYPKSELKKLKQMQTLLGDIQDSRVYMNELKLFFDAGDPVMLSFYEAPTKAIINKRILLLEEFQPYLQRITELWQDEFFIFKANEKISD